MRITLKQLSKKIIEDLPEEDKKVIKEYQEDDLISLHFGFGTNIRNEYGLWEDTVVVDENNKPIEKHPDDISMEIIETIWKELRK